MNNKKVFLVVVLICFSTTIYFYKKNIDNEPKITTKHISVNKENSIKKNINYDGLDSIYQRNFIEEPTDEIVDFNLELIVALGYDNDSTINEIGQFTSKKRSNPKDVVDKINEYFSNIEENQIEINDLILRCTKIEQTLKKYQDGLLDNTKQLSEISFNEYYFYQGLAESSMCDYLGTARDPFYEMLKLARKGNKLSQLLLVDNLYIATQRGLINVLKEPLEYKSLRDEAVLYLQYLSIKGVTRASEKLGRLYSVHSTMIPADYILQYYYSYLAKKQEGVEKVFIDLNGIYENLSEKQKSIVDRMTENL